MLQKELSLIEMFLPELLKLFINSPEKEDHNHGRCPIWLETGLKSTLDDAILEHTEIIATGRKKIDEVPFDFERRRGVRGRAKKIFFVVNLMNRIDRKSSNPASWCPGHCRP